MRPLQDCSNFAVPKAIPLRKSHSSLTYYYTMERNKQVQLGLLGLLAILLVANLFGGGFKNWFNKSESDKIRESAASVISSNQNGNIPGTNTNATPASDAPITAIQYESERYDFGTTDEGEIVKHSYKFKNTGTEDLIISNCKGSCGCTVPIWPKEPIPPGGTGEINIEFNSKGKPGRQTKRVTVTANTNPTETFLEITGDVKGKEQPTAKGE